MRFVFGFLLLLHLAMPARAQNRVDLDDLEVKGDLLNDNRLRMSAREPNAMADRVKYRLQYRDEILEGLKSEVPNGADLLPVDQGPGSSH